MVLPGTLWLQSPADTIVGLEQQIEALKQALRNPKLHAVERYQLRRLLEKVVQVYVSKKEHKNLHKPSRSGVPWHKGLY